MHTRYRVTLPPPLPRSPTLSHTHTLLGSAREMAALLLGRLLTRPDMGGALSDFLAWSTAAVRDAAGLQHEPFLVCGESDTLLVLA